MSKLRERYTEWQEQARTKPFAQAAIELEDSHREALDVIDEMASALKIARPWTLVASDGTTRTIDKVLAKYEGKS